MIRTLIICMTALTLNAAVLTDPWSVDLRKHGAVDRTYKQGETIDMRVTVQDGFTAYDLTGARAVFYWFTNSVGNVWWTNSVSVATPKTGVLSVRWTPAMDVGALAYPYWIGIWPSGSTSPVWRLTGTIKLLPSPGFVPNSLVPPVRVLDFAAVTVTNAPWLKASDWQSGSNAFAEALQRFSESTNGWEVGSHGAFAVSTTVFSAMSDLADRIDAIPPPSYDALRLMSTNAAEWIDGEGGRWRITQTAITNADQLLIYDSTMSSYGVRVMNRVGSSDQWSVGTYDYDLLQAGDIYAESGFIVQGWVPGMEYMWTLLAAPYDLSTFPKTYAHPSNGHTGWVDRVITYQVTTSKWSEVANKSDILPPVPAAFTNVPLYTLAGSNYYWRWSSEQGTYVTTGVPQ